MSHPQPFNLFIGKLRKVNRDVGWLETTSMGSNSRRPRNLGLSLRNLGHHANRDSTAPVDIYTGQSSARGSFDA